MSDSYHHGNLKQALIDASVKIINESGESGLSLRKAAALCNVSHAAPYAHFKDKEELIEEIKKNVTGQFMEELQNAVREASDAESALISMGRRYVLFFLHNPDYFKFLFGSQNIVAHFRTDKEYEEDYPPFKLLKEIYINFLREKNIKKKKNEQELDLLKLWSSAHGLAAIACMSKVKLSCDWKKAIEGDILLK